MQDPVMNRIQDLTHTAPDNCAGKVIHNILSSQKTQLELKHSKFNFCNAICLLKIHLHTPCHTIIRQSSPFTIALAPLFSTSEPDTQFSQVSPDLDPQP